MKVMLWVSSAILLGGCAANRVRCDGHLEPINAPAPRMAPAEVRSDTAPGVVRTMPAPEGPGGAAP